MDIIGYDPIAEIGLGFSNLIQSQDIPQSASALNWGCGIGDTAFVIRRCVGTQGRVIGIDYSAHNISLARQNCGNFGYNNVTFFYYPSIIKHNGTDLSSPCRQTVFDEATFDIIVCNYLLNLIPARAGILQEIYRLLKPDGRLILTDFFANKLISNQITEEIMQKYLQQTHQDYIDVIANPVINLLENVSSNSLMLLEDYITLVKSLGFGKVNVKRKNSIDNSNGELLLYMDCDKLEELVQTETAFYKADLLIEK